MSTPSQRAGRRRVAGERSHKRDSTDLPYAAAMTRVCYPEARADYLIDYGHSTAQAYSGDLEYLYDWV